MYSPIRQGISSELKIGGNLNALERLVTPLEIKKSGE